MHVWREHCDYQLWREKKRCCLDGEPGSCAERIRIDDLVRSILYLLKNGCILLTSMLIEVWAQ